LLAPAADETPGTTPEIIDILVDATATGKPGAIRKPPDFNTISVCLQVVVHKIAHHFRAI
jgi:hypothetical protein